MIIDCDSCTVRGAACTDCVVTFLTIPVRPSGHVPGVGVTGTSAASATSVSAASGTAPGRSATAGSVPVDLDADERAALDVLASSGLVPPLRMVRAL